MKALAQSATWGKPASVRPQQLFMLPIQMQAEGVRLLAEMGLSGPEIARRLGLSLADTVRLAGCPAEPFRRRNTEGESA